MKKWPKNGTAVDMEKLLSPLRRFLGQFYKLTPLGKIPEYKGYDANPAPAFNPDLSFQLSKKGLAENEDQNRDAATMILTGAFWLGIEQGRRMEVIRGSVDGLSARKDFLFNLLRNLNEHPETNDELKKMIVKELLAVDTAYLKALRLKH